MHSRIDSLYHLDCEDCSKPSTVLNLGITDKFKQLLNAGEKAFKELHKNEGYMAEDLQTNKAYQNLVNKTFEAFDFAITSNDMPDEMRNALQADAFLFGGLKANAQLFEASKLLLAEDGTLKPFEKISEEFSKLNIKYNQNYLEAEYQFAVSSSQMAAKWSELDENGRYNLQYRTAKDERVRASHQLLADITLPQNDSFWNSFYPPNGWRCRCTAVEVLKQKYETSDSTEAIKAGNAATTEIGKSGKNRLEIFRFNPGQKKIVFPPAHPYNKVSGATKVKKQSTRTKKQPPFEINNDAIAELKKLGYDIQEYPEGRKFFNENFKG